MWNKIKVILLVIGGVALAVITFGKYKDNKLLQKARKLKEDASEDYHTTKSEEKMKQEDRQSKVDESRTNKEKLDDSLESLKNDIKKNGPKMLIFMIIIVISFTGVGRAQEQESLPDTYSGMKDLYFDTLDELVKVKNQRDEAVRLSEEYKKEYEVMGKQYDNAEDSVDSLEITIDDLYDTIKKQNEIIIELSTSNNVSVSGGVVYDPGSDGSDAKPFAAVSLNF